MIFQAHVEETVTKVEEAAARDDTDPDMNYNADENHQGTGEVSFDPDMHDENVSTDSDSEPMKSGTKKSKVDTVFETLGLLPIDITKVQKRDYIDNKIEELKSAILDQIGISEEDEIAASTKSLILGNIKENYSGLNKEQRVAVLAILPKRWPVRENCRTTGASRRLLTCVRNGTVYLVRKIHKNKVSSETVDTIQDFYLYETNSRIQPGNQN